MNLSSTKGVHLTLCLTVFSKQCQVSSLMTGSYSDNEDDTQIPDDSDLLSIDCTGEYFRL